MGKTQDVIDWSNSHPEELANFEGEYVAIHQTKGIVDHDSDLNKLHQRILHTFSPGAQNRIVIDRVQMLDHIYISPSAVPLCKRCQELKPKEYPMKKVEAYEATDGKLYFTVEEAQRADCRVELAKQLSAISNWVRDHSEGDRDNNSNFETSKITLESIESLRAILNEIRPSALKDR